MAHRDREPYILKDRDGWVVLRPYHLKPFINHVTCSVSVMAQFG